MSNDGDMTAFQSAIAEWCGRLSKACADEVEATMPRIGIDQETWRFWRANAGNAKARRRWRRRSIPNSQREAEAFHRHLMENGTNPGGPRLQGISLVGPDGGEFLP